MKSAILYLCLLLSIVSCGEKKESAKTNFKILLSGTSSVLAVDYPAGLLLMGRRIEGGQSFVVKFEENLELNLNKGDWEFMAIGWTGATGVAMEGAQKCSYQRVELRDNAQDVRFSMSKNNCANLRTHLGEEISSTQFIMNSSSSTITFKPISFKMCSQLDYSSGLCVSPSNAASSSARIILPAKMEGIASAAPELSECVNFNASGVGSVNLYAPAGGENGFIRTNLEVYQNPNCAGVATKKYSFAKGLGSIVVPLAAMSAPVAISPTGSFEASKMGILRYQGAWTSANLPAAVAGNLYLDSVGHASSSIPVNYYMYHNGFEWRGLSPSQILINGATSKVYFTNTAYTLFIEE